MADVPTADDAPASWYASQPKRLPDDPHDGLGLNGTSAPAPLVKGLTDLAEKKKATDEGLAGSMAATFKMDRARVEEALNAEHAIKVQPWDEKSEAAKRQSDPVEDFASLGSVFGILASAFTHAPMTNAIAASASAINAIKANDAEDYKRAYDAWKQNTDMAFKRADLEHRQFSDAVTLMKENMSAGMEMAKMNAIQTNDQKSLLYLENGMVPEWEDFQTKKATLKEKLADAALKQAKDMAIMDDRMNLIANYKDEFKTKNGREPTPIEMQHAMPAINRQWMEETAPYHVGTGTNAMIEQRTQAYYNDPDSPTHGNLIASQDRALKEIKSESSTKQPTIGEQYVAAAKAEWQAANPGRSVPSAMLKKWGDEAPKPQTIKAASNQEETRIALAPSLMTDLTVMDTLINEGAGAFTGKLKEVVSKVFGTNDPVIAFNAARADAEAKIASLQSRGSQSVLAIKHVLDTLPAVTRASEFGRKQAHLDMTNLREETQSIVNTMLAGGKKIDPYNLDRLKEMGVYPGERQQQDPILKLNQDPASVSDEELKTLFRLRGSYPEDTRQKISDEILRRTGVKPSQP